jgi:hypothetical protein
VSKPVELERLTVTIAKVLDALSKGRKA